MDQAEQRVPLPGTGRRAILTAGLAGAALAMPRLARAAAWPSQPIRIIVPFAPGGPTDISARVLAEAMSREGMHALVENRTGAGAVVGTQSVAQAAPDGHTFLMSTIAHAVMPAVTPDLSFNPHRDLSPVALLGVLPLIGVVSPALPAKDLADFIAQAKAKPDAFSYASAGAGTAQHLAGELFKARAGVRLEHIPYRGMAPAMTDLVAGTVTFAFDTVTTSLDHVRSGRVKPLAVTSPQRLPDLPEVPTVSDTLAGFEAYTWNMLLAPQATPMEIQDRMAATVRRLLAREDVGGRMRGFGMQLRLDTNPQNATAFVQAEVEKWLPLLRDTPVTRANGG
jgi:tripartite-type tricarboxylate transporter receptor subunit TctC